MKNERDREGEGREQRRREREGGTASEKETVRVNHWSIATV